MEDIMTVIRDKELKNTQLLEVNAKQQKEAQAAAAAAITAQNEALKSFPGTIASVVVPMSQRPHTAVHLPEKRPQVSGLGWRPDTFTPQATPGRSDQTNQGDPRHRGSTLRQARNGCRGLRAL